MGISPELRKRLQELNRGPLTFRDKPAPAPSQPEQKQAEDAAGEIYSAAAIRAAGGQVILEETAPGEVIETSRHGKCYLIRKTYREMLPEGASFMEKYVRAFDGGAFAWRESELHADLRPLLNIDPRQVVFLDIETTGLSSTPIFLIGIMHFDGADLVLRQVLARDYAEEAAMLQVVAEALSHFAVLVTYNGKSFDMPYIRDRGIAHCIAAEFDGFHIDLLHEARRRYRGVFPNCKLQTLEMKIAGRVRTGDIPGAFIPQAYHDFVSTGNALQMCDILHHNALDLIAMAEIALFMVEGSPQ